MRPVVLGAIAVMAFVATGAAASTYGTEANPELVDMAGDIDYDDAHVGAQDHEYLDLLSSWFEYDTQSDVVVVTIKVTDATALSDAPTDWVIRCYVKGDVVADEETRGTLTYRAVKLGGQTEFESVVEFDANPGQTVQGFDAKEELRHEYTLEATEPGYHEFRVDRALSQQLADEIRDMEAWCTEEYQPAANFGVYGNGDRATSKAAYSFEELRPTRTADGADLPVSENQANETTTPGPTDDPGGSAGGPGPTIVLLAVAASVIPAAFVAKRRRR